MTDLPAPSEAASAGPGNSAWPVAIAVLGAVWLAVLAWAFAARIDYPFHSSDVYDLYYHALLEGRLDLPVRALRFEGHYAPDGTGFLYHGIGPVVTRFALGWAWPFETLSLAGPSIWLWATVGTAGFQAALIGLARRAALWEAHRTAFLILAAGLWLCGPGLLLVANHALYHEPIALAFAMTGLFAALWVRVARGQTGLPAAMVLLAVLAAVTVQARPNVAVGLYAGVGIAILWGLWRHRLRALLPAAAATAILGASGLGFLALNEARFGSATAVDGSFSASQIVYGSAFFGIEEPDSQRARAAEEHGRFNALRVAPNLALYSFDFPPIGPVRQLSYKALGAYYAVTRPMVGFIRVEFPRVGMVFLWPVWVWLALKGLRAVRRDPQMAGLVVATGVSTLLMLSYATVTLRYRFDLWPGFFVLAAMGLVWLLGPSGEAMRPKRLVPVLVALVGIGTVVSLSTGYAYSRIFRDSPELLFFAPWSYEDCAAYALEAGLPEAEHPRICRDPWDAG